MVRVPAPALRRGLDLIRLLAEQGPSATEELVTRTALPRTSLLRLLAVLEEHGAVDRGEDRRWRACMRFTTMRPLEAIGDWQAILAELTRRFGIRAELWRFDDAGCELLQRHSGPAWTQAVYAYPGWRPENVELLAPVLLWHATRQVPPPARCWYWRGRRRRWLGRDAVAGLVDAARLSGRAGCPAVGPEGLRRLAVPICEPSGRALGALCAVQSSEEAVPTDDLIAYMDRAASRRRRGG